MENVTLAFAAERNDFEYSDGFCDRDGLFLNPRSGMPRSRIERQGQCDSTPTAIP
ncbi:MAG: hypothetical protein IGR92_14435 [Leptolyngbyaceae cyanobacterium T60_A2020_046]|nr:hypothetical protein [Leptolyngbyaceae cyanobacterium T60_A2020_046]